MGRKDNLVKRFVTKVVNSLELHCCGFSGYEQRFSSNVSSIFVDIYAFGIVIYLI